MKKLILLIFVVSSAYSQKSPFPIDSLTGKVTYREIVSVDSMSKKDLFRTAKKWIAESYKSANDVIQYEDMDEGKIIAKGNFDIEELMPFDVNDSTKKSVVKTKLLHMINIDTRDNKVRISITNIKRIVSLGKTIAKTNESPLEDFKITSIDEAERRIAFMEKDQNTRRKKAEFIVEGSKRIPVQINHSFNELLDNFKKYIIAASKESKW